LEGWELIDDLIYQNFWKSSFSLLFTEKEMIKAGFKTQTISNGYLLK
jgi:hypothetical protein